MGTVFFDTSMSLDGFTTAAGQTLEEPMGIGGQALTEWAFGTDERNRAYLEEWIGRGGAVIAGRVTYDTSLPWWGPDGPSGPARLPVFVVTHTVPDDPSPDGVYRFVTDGIEAALAQAQQAAGEKNVTIMGGASLGRQYLAAGLVDEISIHLVPVLFGTGTHMFEPLGDDPIALEQVEVVDTPQATHLRYRVAR